MSDSFKRFADVVPLMMWRSDEHGHAIHHNECWLEFTGRRASRRNSASVARRGAPPRGFRPPRPDRRRGLRGAQAVRGGVPPAPTRRRLSLVAGYGAPLVETGGSRAISAPASTLPTASMPRSISSTRSPRRRRCSPRSITRRNNLQVMVSLIGRTDARRRTPAAAASRPWGSGSGRSRWCSSTSRGAAHRVHRSPGYLHRLASGSASSAGPAESACRSTGRATGSWSRAPPTRSE